MKRLRAFTIVELIVVMIISSVTLITIYTVYLLIKKQYNRYENKSVSLSNFLLFNNALKADFLASDSIKADDDSISCVCYRYGKETKYSFSDKAIIRSYTDVIDSFTLFPYDLKLVQEYKKVVSLSVGIVCNKDSIGIQVNKQYDANSLLQTMPD